MESNSSAPLLLIGTEDIGKRILFFSYFVLIMVPMWIVSLRKKKIALKQGFQ